MSQVFSAKDPTLQRPVSIAMVGAGFIGQLGHLRNYVQIPDCRVAAVAEARPKLRANVQARYGIEKAVASHKALLDDDAIDGFAIVTRRHHAGPIALELLEAGRSVFTEKPMAATLEQAEQLAKAAADQNVRVYALGFMRRHDEGVQRAKRILDELTASGELGPILYARIHCFGGEDYCKIDGFVGSGEERIADLPGWPTAPDWLPKELHAPYDTFMNVSTHDINLLRFLFGEPQGIRYVDIRAGGSGVIHLDMGQFPLEFAFGDMQHEQWDEGVEIVFRHGRMRIELPPALLRNAAARVELYRGNVNRTEVSHPGWSWAFRRQAEAFVADIREQRRPLASGQDGLGDMKLIDQIWRRIAGGQV